MAGGIVFPGGNVPAEYQAHTSGPGSVIGNFLHWVWYGKAPGAGLGAVPGQFAQSVNPTTKAGAANLLSMLFGGGDSPLEGEMPGQFEAYSPTKAGLSGHLGSTHEGQPHQLNYAIRAANKGVPAGRYGDWAKFVHDSLFGGEAHTRGPIPKSSSPHEFTRSQEQARAMEDMNNLHEMLQRSNAHQARERAVAEMLHNHGIQEPPHPARAMGRVVGFKNNPNEASHYVHGEESHLVTPHEVHNDPTILHRLTGGHPLAANAARTAALKRLMAARMMHNHGMN